MTRSQLTDLLFFPGPKLVTIKGHTGYIISVEREDGSGRCFNITLQVGRERKTLFVRTID